MIRHSQARSAPVKWSTFPSSTGSISLQSLVHLARLAVSPWIALNRSSYHLKQSRNIISHMRCEGIRENNAPLFTVQLRNWTRVPIKKYLCMRFTHYACKGIHTPYRKGIIWIPQKNSKRCCYLIIVKITQRYFFSFTGKVVTFLKSKSNGVGPFSLLIFLVLRSFDPVGSRLDSSR